MYWAFDKKTDAKAFNCGTAGAGIIGLGACGVLMSIYVSKWDKAKDKKQPHGLKEMFAIYNITLGLALAVMFCGNIQCHEISHGSWSCPTQNDARSCCLWFVRRFLSCHKQLEKRRWTRIPRQKIHEHVGDVGASRRTIYFLHYGNRSYHIRILHPEPDFCHFILYYTLLEHEHNGLNRSITKIQFFC